MTSIKMHVIVDPSSGFKYIVTPSPDSNSIYSYKNFLFNNSVSRVLRLCDECTYDDEYLNSQNINVTHMPLKDGDIPDENVVDQWIKIIKNEKNGIAVHCRAGLGRAPMFVCIGLICVGGMKDVEAINLVRKNIKCALNTKQINFLCNELKKSKNDKKSCCIIM